MWFGTDEGLTKLSNQIWTSYTTTEGLTDNYINSITEDNNGNLWIGTNFGASKLNIYQSIEDLTNEKTKLSLFPNPASTTIKVSANEIINSIEVYNINGILLRTISCKSNVQTIDISDLPAGSYFVRVLGKDSTWVEKFVVIR